MHLFRFDGGRIGITADGASHDITDALGIDPRGGLRCRWSR